MKKRIFAFTIAVVFAGAFSGCGRDTTEQNLNVTPIDVSGYQENIHNKDQALEVSEEDFSGLRYEYSGVSYSSNYQQSAVDLLKNLDYIDRLNGCSVNYNKRKEAELNGLKYVRFIDRKFGSVEDVNSFINMNLTSALVSEKYQNITGGDDPCLADIDGQIFIRDDARKSGFDFICDENGDPAVSIENITDDSFTAVVSYDESGAVSQLKAEIIREGNLWMINSFETESSVSYEENYGEDEYYQPAEEVYSEENDYYEYSDEDYSW